MTTLHRSLPPLATLLLLSATALAADNASGSFGDDRFVAGDDVTLDEQVAGDAFVAGGRSQVAGRVAGDAVVTGGTVEVRGEIEEDVYAAGGDVRLEARVGGNVRAAGGTVAIEPAARIAGNVTLAGGNVDVGGRVDRNLQVFGGRVRIDGEVGGDVEVASDDIRIGPGARIGGRLTYSSPRPPQLAEGAVVTGGIEKRQREWRGIGAESGLGRVVKGMARTIWFAGVLLVGIALIALFPEFSREAAATVRSEPLPSIGLGLALLIAVPILAVMLFVTIIGIPLGFAVLLGYGLALMLGYMTGALALADLLLARAKPAEAGKAGWRILFLVLSLVAIALLRRVPLIGELAVVVLFLAGFGAFALRVLRRYRSGGAGAALSAAAAAPRRPGGG
jgi:cytoskeletal protein CcmA (bactofilin family)